MVLQQMAGNQLMYLLPIFQVRMGIIAVQDVQVTNLQEVNP